MNRAWKNRRANSRTVQAVKRAYGNDTRPHRMVRQILGTRKRHQSRAEVEAWIAAGKPPF